jgi:hypothetical protein
MSDAPGITIHVRAPDELIAKFGDDVIDPDIDINIDTQTFTYVPSTGAPPVTGTLDNEGLEAIGRILLWTLRTRLSHHADVNPLNTVELF